MCFRIATIHTSKLNDFLPQFTDFRNKGWKEIGIEDLGEDLESGDDVEYEQCEMCGQEKIRYV